MTEFNIKRVTSLPSEGKNGDIYLLKKPNGRFSVYSVAPDGTLAFNQGITDEQNSKLDGLKTQLEITNDITTSKNEVLGQVYTRSETNTKQEIDAKLDTAVSQAQGTPIEITGTVLPQGASVPAYITNVGTADLFGGDVDAKTYTQTGGFPIVVSAGKLRKGFYNRSTNLWTAGEEFALPKVEVIDGFTSSDKTKAGSADNDRVLKEAIDLINESPALKNISIITNDEFLYAIVDVNESLLWGKRRDGSTYDCDLSIYDYTDSQIEDVKKLISELSLSVEFIKNDYLPKSAVKNERGNSITNTIAQKLFTDFADSYDSKISLVTNSEYLYAIVDNNNTLLWGKRRDGTTYDCDKDIPQTLNILKNEVAITNIKTITNAEYLYAIVTKDNVLLWGKRRDGSTYDSDTTIINEIESLKNKVTNLDTKISVISNQEFLYAIVDSNNVLLWGKRRDGSTFDSDLTISADVVKLKERLSFYDSTVSVVSNPEFIDVTVDKNNRLIEAIKGTGERFIKSLDAEKFKTDDVDLGSNAQNQIIKNFDDNNYLKNRTSEISKNLIDAGFKSDSLDWSNSKLVRLPISQVPAMINIIMPNLPTTKVDDYKGSIEFWDYEGNYFKKKIVLNAQGNSSLVYQKKNFSLDLDDSSKIQFGDWVIQDSWHLKAHYTDTLKSNNNVAYDIFEYLAKKRPYGNSRVWDYAVPSSTQINGVGVLNNDFNTGARGFPDGFPCALYHNGSFYGIYMFNLKKHRDNYKMNRGDVNQIHLDGELGQNSIFNGNTINWSAFEIRNPNPRLKQEGWELLDIDGNKYDGDNPKELSNDGNSGLVKQAIIRLAGSVNAIKASPTKQTFESYFANVWMFLDYFIIANRVGNGDAFDKNWQWLTYNGGDKWTIAPYDWDGGLGVDHLGNTCVPVPSTGGIEGVFYDTPSKLLYQIYKPELNARYKELTDNKGIMTTEGMFNFYKKRTDWIGYDLFSKENTKWSDMPGYRSSNINTPWVLKSISVTTAPINYNPNTIYEVNSEVVYGLGTERYTFVASAQTQGVAPLSGFYGRYPNVLGFYDGLSRKYEWLKAREVRMNAIFNYN